MIRFSPTKNIVFSDGCEALLPNIDGTSQIAYYFNDGRWNYICGNTMTQEVADVICKENGNTTARAYRSVSLDFGPLMFPIYGSRFQCNGTELTLCDCESISQTCSSMQILEVQCDLPGNFDFMIHRLEASLIKLLIVPIVELYTCIYIFIIQHCTTIISLVKMSYYSLVFF